MLHFGGATGIRRSVRAMPSLDAVMQDVFARFTAKDAPGVAAMFADTGTLIDPNYPPPLGPAMTGPEAVEAGLGWAFGIIQRSEFTPTSTFLDPDAPGRGAMEVSTTHTLQDGSRVDLTQVFVIELDGEGRISRMQSYTPYPPRRADPG